MYYIKDNNDKIIFYDDDKEKLINTLIFKPEFKEDDILETENGYTVYDFELMTNEEKEKKRKRKRRRTNKQSYDDPS